MERQQPSAGSAIEHQLKLSEADLDQAAHLDSQWRQLDSSVHALVMALEKGQAAPPNVPIELTNGCNQFAGTSAQNGPPVS